MKKLVLLVLAGIIAITLLIGCKEDKTTDGVVCSIYSFNYVDDDGNTRTRYSFRCYEKPSYARKQAEIEQAKALDMGKTCTSVIEVNEEYTFYYYEVLAG